MTDHVLGDHLTGPSGEAYRLDPDLLRAGLSGDTVATLDYWWIRIPGQTVLVAHAGAEPKSIDAVRALEVMVPNPGDAMDTFAVGVITLADLPGVKPATRSFPWVTHELIVHTVDTTRGPVVHTDPMPWRLMQPHNLSVQFEVRDDDQARHLTHDLVAAVVHGLLPPEVQAYVPERHKMMTLAPLWNLWQDTVRVTAEHIRTDGSHDEGHR